MFKYFFELRVFYIKLNLSAKQQSLVVQFTEQEFMDKFKDDVEINKILIINDILDLGLDLKCLRKVKNKGFVLDNLQWYKQSPYSKLKISKDLTLKEIKKLCRKLKSCN